MAYQVFAVDLPVRADFGDAKPGRGEPETAGVAPAGDSETGGARTATVVAVDAVPNLRRRGGQGRTHLRPLQTQPRPWQDHRLRPQRRPMLQVGSFSIIHQTTAPNIIVFSVCSYLALNRLG